MTGKFRPLVQLYYASKTIRAGNRTRVKTEEIETGEALGFDPAQIRRIFDLGSSWWGVRAVLGLVLPLGPKLLFEADLGVWLLGDDPDDIGGYREQERIVSTQLHLVRCFKPGFWASLDFNYYRGGRQTLDGRQLEDVQQNSRLGGTVVVPLKGRHAIKLGFPTGVFTRFGTDFDQYMVSYQVLLNTMKH